MTTPQIRPTRADDLPALRRVVSETGLFPADMLQDMVAPALTGASDAIWLTCFIDGDVVGFCYSNAEPMADRVWNMLALAVSPHHQRHGAGQAIVSALENRLKDDAQRLVIVETSGTDAFQATRRFYEQAGYARTARIGDYWEDGDDKIIFCKRL